MTTSIQKLFYNETASLYAESLAKRDPELMWGKGVMFSALVAAARHESVAYRPVLDRFFAAMDRYWDERAGIPGYEPAPTTGDGHHQYYDDNEWMVIAFMEAYDLTQDVKYLDRAEQTLKFCLSGWDDQLGGIQWHVLHKGASKNTCANGAAAVVCLRVARCRQCRENVQWARKLIRWTASIFRIGTGCSLTISAWPTAALARGSLPTTPRSWCGQALGCTGRPPTRATWPRPSGLDRPATSSRTRRPAPTAMHQGSFACWWNRTWSSTAQQSMRPVWLGPGATERWLGRSGGPRRPRS